MLFFILLLFIVLSVFVYKYIKRNRAMELINSLKEFEGDFIMAVKDAEVIKNSKWYVSDWQYRKWKEQYAFLREKVDQEFLEIKIEDSFVKIVLQYLDFFDDGRKSHINKINEKFIKQEAPIIKDILDNKNIKNNSDQLIAIASDEDNTLLVAGAGTGKTTTILGKLAYLLDRVNIKAEEILLLSFTGGAVKELSSRIESKFGQIDVKAKTFHSFGLSIIGKAIGKKPSIAFAESSEKKIFFNENFNDILQDEKYLKLAVYYFAFYLRPVVLEPGFSNLNDYYKYIKTEGIITLKKEFVKSQQEAMIANFLYLNGVDYVYESSYEYETANVDYGQYKPDFFLPEYGIYLEHFGINRNGETKFTSDNFQNSKNSEKYRQQMDWKRELHAKHRTILIESYSYEFLENNWQELLTDKLKLHSVKFDLVDMQKVYDSLAKSVDIKKIIDLFVVFLDLSKSNGYSMSKLSEKISTRNILREQAFFALFSPLYEKYENYLKDSGLIDFHDMLIQATELISSGKIYVKLRYIIIDEFQDFSVSKYHLVKALCEQNPDAKLFCVGDDWQSIFRFSGSDISLMTEFEQSYGFTRKNQLVVTNRFNDRLAAVSNNFILKNPQQIQKKVVANFHSEKNAIEIYSSKKYDDANHLLREIFETISKITSKVRKKITVLILGRYNYNKPSNISVYQNDYTNLSIEFMTIHASKGTEADYVVIMDMVSGKYGFPSGVVDDPILGIVLSEGESYPHAEERRLMYVAMTRARQKVFIITEDHHESVFVLELEGLEKNDDEIVRCLECGGEMTKRFGKFGVFYGCMNFPSCNNTKKC